MKLIDISMELHSSMLTWQNEFKPEIVQYMSIKSGDNSNTTYSKMDLHTGTHVDLPYHFLEDGKKLDDIDIGNFCGKCCVVNIPGETISAAQLNILGIPQVERVLFKTFNSNRHNEPFIDNYVALDESAARWLIEKKIVLAGIDYISIEKPHDSDFPVHKLLLSNNVIILEGLKLDLVEPGIYNLYALPIKYTGVEASPVRAVLIPI